MCSRIAWLLTLAFTAIPISAARASLVVQDWLLETLVRDSNDRGYEFSNDVANPFDTVHVAELGDSRAQTTFDLSWSSDQGSFGFQVGHEGAGTDPTLLTSLSAGFIDFRSDHDVLFSITGSYSYNLPRGDMQTIANCVISNGVTQPSQQYFAAGGYADTFLGPPRSGSIDLSGNVLLPAGVLYHIDYRTEVLAYGPVGGLATGDGGFHFTLQEVPEPATAIPLVLGAALVRKRRVKTGNEKNNSPAD